jgi:DNA adenine methylase
MGYKAVLDNPQIALIPEPAHRPAPLRGGLLKWIGNKQRYAREIVSSFPREFGTYFEPFVGSAAVLATLHPARAVASDTFAPLVEILQTLVMDPDSLKRWYKKRWLEFSSGERREQYERIKARYNKSPNAADLLFLCRACYGGVVRFRKMDGYMSTPCGIHDPIRPESFSARVDEWSQRLEGTMFLLADFRETMRRAEPGDLVYCDPPYHDTQRILYGAQEFSLEALFEEIASCKSRGVYVALSIDGTKRSGKYTVELPVPRGLFEQELFIHGPASMLKRFQAKGRSLHNERVSDRLLLTY